MTGVDVAAIRAALEAATPGEWRTSATQEDNPVVYIEINPEESHARVLFEADWGTDEDAELIVLLRNNAEALLNRLYEADMACDTLSCERNQFYDLAAERAAALERAQAASEGVDMLIAQAERRAWDEGFTKAGRLLTGLDDEAWPPAPNPYREVDA